VLTTDREDSFIMQWQANNPLFMSMSLQDRVALVIGGGSGIGAQSAQTLAALGATVVVGDLNAAGADATAAAVTRNGGTAWGATVDAGDHDSVGELVAKMLERHGRVDVLHNNAAALGVDVLGSDRDLHTLTTDVVSETFRVNVYGVIWGCKHVLPVMIEQGSGSIINTSSVLAQRGDLQRAAYGASKAAVDSLTLYVATQYGRSGIRCNAVAPGFIITRQGVDQSNYGRLLAGASAMGEAGHPTDVASAVAFLASDAGRHITGQVLAVDGGQSIPAPWVAQQWQRRAQPAVTA
jgi:NAD(P)-dependent dehydrogenase (short-subunit alcohol dehydrogenase family)